MGRVFEVELLREVKAEDPSTEENYSARGENYSFTGAEKSAQEVKKEIVSSSLTINKETGSADASHGEAMKKEDDQHPVDGIESRLAERTAAELLLVELEVSVGVDGEATSGAQLNEAIERGIALLRAEAVSFYRIRIAQSSEGRVNLDIFLEGRQIRAWISPEGGNPGPGNPLAGWTARLEQKLEGMGIRLSAPVTEKSGQPAAGFRFGEKRFTETRQTESGPRLPEVTGKGGTQLAVQGELRHLGKTVNGSYPTIRGQANHSKVTREPANRPAPEKGAGPVASGRPGEAVPPLPRSSVESHVPQSTMNPTTEWTGRTFIRGGGENSKPEEGPDGRREGNPRVASVSGPGPEAAAMRTSPVAGNRQEAAQSVLQALQERIEMHRNQQSTRLRFQVNLEKGEKIEVLLSLKGNQLKTTFLTDSETLRVALREGWDSFSRSFNERGMRADTARFLNSSGEETAGEDERREREAEWSPHFREKDGRRLTRTGRVLTGQGSSTDLPHLGGMNHNLNRLA